MEILLNPNLRQARKFVIALLIALTSLPVLTAQADIAAAKRLEQGKQLAMARNKGNCLACHAILMASCPEIWGRHW